MYIINLREDRIEGNAFAEVEQLFDLDQARQINQISKAELIQAIEQKNILILVHGFYQPIVDVLSFYLTLEQHYQKSLSGHYEAIIGFIWPGGESKFDYYQAKQHAKKAGTHFQNWMKRLNNAQSTIDVISHGMGSLVVYHSIRVPEDFTIRNIFSIGPGIPQEVITNNSLMNRVQNRVKNIYVLYIEKSHSPGDRVPGTVTQKPLANSDSVNWEKELSRLNNVSLANITELISYFPGYQSLTIVTEFIATLLLSSQYPRRITLNEAKKSISKSTIKNEH